MQIQHQPEVTGASAVLPYSEWLESLYTFTTKFKDVVKACYQEGGYLHVPRNSAPVGKHDLRISHPRCAIDCAFVPKNEEQAQLVERSVNLLLSGEDHVFEAPTGWGKSVVGSVIACRLGQPTMIVVNKTDLMDAWYDALVNVLKINPALIGKVQQNTCDWKGKRFIIGMVQSLIGDDKYPQEMYRYPGLLILDEVHLMAADQFVNVCWKFPAKHRLGFSATTTRADGKWPVIVAHVGQVRCIGTQLPMKPKILVKKTGWAIPRYPDKETGEMIKIPHAAGRMALVNRAMAANKERNQLIARFLKSAFDAGRHPLVLSDLKEAHLDRIFKAVVAEGISGNHIGYYVGGMGKHELEASKKCRIVLATYGMCSTGTNVPHWDTLVMATPRVDIRQPVGRILRAVDEKKQPVVLDLIDHDTIFNGFYQSRLKHYYRLGAEVVLL